LLIYGYEVVTGAAAWVADARRKATAHPRAVGSAHPALALSAGGSGRPVRSLAGSSASPLERQTSSNVLANRQRSDRDRRGVLAGVVTFLDFGGRAERHPKAAADYKQALRKLEAIGRARRSARRPRG